MATINLNRPDRRRFAGPRTSGKLARAASTGGFHLISGVLTLAFLFPLLWALLNSVKGQAEANQQPPTWFPRTWSLENYRGLASYGEGIGTYLFNSLVLSGLTVAGTVVVCALGGYGFARFEFRGHKPLFGLTLAILMVPYATILLPLYIVLGKLGLQNSVVGLALVLVMFQLPFGIFLMRNSFESVPRELEEAAMVDGCSTFGAMRRVALPIVMPGLVTVGLFAFLASWNEFLAPLIFLNDGTRYTLPIMLVNVRYGAYGIVDYGALQAGVVIAMVPCLVLYLLLQRFYVSGIVNGALRG
ncbi:carbohydrate ABC transporter permease [Micromonospora sp. NPDC048930]|uniref:carbohydrate ABC transporter permease n=1 Tax=Micromonospora sp. NPDC048930 TaxID=3364261 RepID=UPI003713A6F9